MGREKDRLLEREEARYAAAKRDGHTCAYCGSVIPYGTDRGRTENALLVSAR